MTNGVTITGFKRKRLDAILADKNSAVRAVLGDNINLAPETPDGQINGLYSGSDADLWELAEACYNAFSPSKATKAALSDLVEINGINRQPATQTVVEVQITGTAGITVPIGSLVSANDGAILFETISDAVIGVGGTVLVDARAREFGPIEVSIGTVNTIDSPITGWTSVTNLTPGILGQFEETDAELRVRRALSVSRAAKNTSDTILAEVLNVPGVVEGFLYENNTTFTDVTTGTPAGQFQVVALGGDPDAIAHAIGSEKPVSVPTFGTSSGIFTDSQGIDHVINFTVPTEPEIYVIVDVDKFANYPADGDDRIKQNIVDYATGVLVDGRGFGVGDNVINSELYTPANLVPGHSINSIKIGLAPVPTLSDDIAIGFNQIAAFDIANIEVI